MGDVFFDISIDEKPAGRIIFKLFDQITPATAQNFRALATGHYGFGYQGSRFSWIAPNEQIVVGDNSTGGQVVPGKFPAENFDVKHDQPGILSLMTSDQNIHGSKFSITIKARPQFDGVNVAFGKVEKGMEIVERISKLDKTFVAPSKPVIITDCGIYTSSSEYAETVKSAWGIFRSIDNNDRTYQNLLKCGKANVEGALDLMQQMLDIWNDKITEDDRFFLVDLMERLCRDANTSPRYLSLNGIDHEARPRASGSFGEVWRAALGSYPVCLKVARVYKDTDMEAFLTTLLRHAIRWCQLIHPNILPFYGVYTLGEYPGTRICLAQPWMVNGSINDYLNSNPDAPRAPLVIDILEGLDYLHNHDVIHGAIKPTNVLITETGSACLADFGLKRSEDLGSMRWQAPELLDSENGKGQTVEPTMKSDIYSLACVIYQIVTGRVPFHEAKRDAAVIFKILTGASPSKPSTFDGTELTEPIWEVMDQCFTADPNERPGVDAVLENLRDLWVNPLTVRRLIHSARLGRLASGGSGIIDFSGDFISTVRGPYSSLFEADMNVLRDLCADPPIVKKEETTQDKSPTPSRTPSIKTEEETPDKPPNLAKSPTMKKEETIPNKVTRKSRNRKR